MRNYKNWIWIVLFGSVWGLAEVFVGESLWGKNLPFASVWLSAFALLILASARGILNEPGSSTAVGAFAALFKLANAAPFYCHLLGIFMIGAVFDLFCTAFLKRDRKASFRQCPDRNHERLWRQRPFCAPHNLRHSLPALGSRWLAQSLPSYLRQRKLDCPGSSRARAHWICPWRKGLADRRAPAELGVWERSGWAGRSLGAGEIGGLKDLPFLI